MLEQVKDYYGKQLRGSSDLKTSACCDPTAAPKSLQGLLAKIHPEVLSRYYGCGLVCPPLLEGARVLDLGCGSGRDTYLLAQLAGPKGSVVGVDMTPEQLDVARDHRQYHARSFGFENVELIEGYIECIDDLGLEPHSFDVIVSNCVVNLSPDKEAVLRGVRRMLKPGGEFYFSDVYSDRRVPSSVHEDPVLYGECLGGALYWKDFHRIARRCGFADPRLVEDRALEINDPELATKTGAIRFYSATFRLFAIDALEDACEDFGQAVIYRGTIPGDPTRFRLDKHHVMEAGRIFPVCGNTWRMLSETRFKPHFDFVGDFSRHYGIFDGCGDTLPFGTGESAPMACC